MRPLPGDADVPHPSFEATRAVAIAAPADRVWPWLVQIGLGRGGFCSYDRLDNAGRPSAREIVPELQGLSLGDEIRLDPKVAGTVTVLDPERALAFCVRGVPILGGKGGRVDMSQAFVLAPDGRGHTRLVVRVRAFQWGRSVLGAAYLHLLFEPMDFVMMRRQLLNLRARAERGGGAGVGVER